MSVNKPQPIPEAVSIMRAIARIIPFLIIAGVLLGCAGTPSGPAPEPLSVAESEAARGADGSLVAEQDDRALTIGINSQKFVYTEGGRVVRVGPISSGKEGYPTPLGQFAVLRKEKDKVSYRYTNQLGWNAWMPYSIQFSGHYFLHEGWLPGYPDSHGCVRVGEQDARFLFERMQIGDPVSVVD
jgi:lipoprotein-anchoring transpeptidase ErfK/SrfK